MIEKQRPNTQKNAEKATAEYGDKYVGDKYYRPGESFDSGVEKIQDSRRNSYLEMVKAKKDIVDKDIEDEKAEEINKLLLAFNSTFLNKPFIKGHGGSVISIALGKELVVLPES